MLLPPLIFKLKASLSGTGVISGLYFAAGSLARLTYLTPLRPGWKSTEVPATPEFPRNAARNASSRPTLGNNDSFLFPTNDNINTRARRSGRNANIISLQRILHSPGCNFGCPYDDCIYAERRVPEWWNNNGRLLIRQRVCSA